MYEVNLVRKVIDEYCLMERNSDTLSLKVCLIRTNVRMFYVQCMYSVTNILHFIRTITNNVL
jgi:hypothetical protein